MQNIKKPTKRLTPKQYAEHKILTAILDGTYPPETALPNERALAEELGVTRPTLRETLHRLSGEGWLLIQHGKPTIVNDYWENGSLGLLNTMAKYGEYLPKEMIGHLLGIRSILLPKTAKKAVEASPHTILKHIDQSESIKNTPDAYVTFDWQLHLIFARESKNPLSKMIINSFESLYLNLGHLYFSFEEGRKSSQKYYQRLINAINKSPENVEKIVEDEMKKSKELWLKIASS